MVATMHVLAVKRQLLYLVVFLLMVLQSIAGQLLEVTNQEAMIVNLF